MRKDVERAFGVFVAHFGVLERKLRGWYINDIKVMVDCCIIIHNMMMEARRDGYCLADLMDVTVEEVKEGAQQDSLFVEEGNQVVELVGQMLVERIGHMSVLMEDVDRHKKLMVYLMVHITVTPG